MAYLVVFMPLKLSVIAKTKKVSAMLMIGPLARVKKAPLEHIQ